MATSTRTLQWQLPTTGSPGGPVDWTRANSVISWLTDLMRGAGWIQAPDSGQVTPATTISALGTYFQIWTPGDGGAKFYLKITYELVDLGNWTQPIAWVIRLGFQVCTGSTDGAGNLVGNVGQKITTSTLKTDRNTHHLPGWECFASADAARLSLLWMNGVTESTPSIINIERSRGLGGEPTAEAVHCHRLEVGVSATSQAVPFLPNIVPTPVPYWGVLLNQGTTTFATGSRIGVSPVFPLFAGVRSPILGLIAYKHVDIAPPKSVGLQIHGANHLYFVPGVAASSAVPGGNDGARVALLWE